MSSEGIEETRSEDYSYENVAVMMSQEEYGMHISLIDTGDAKKGTPVYGIKIETDLDSVTIKNIMEGLLEQMSSLEES